MLVIPDHGIYIDLRLAHVVVEALDIVTPFAWIQTILYDGTEATRPGPVRESHHVCGTIPKRIETDGCYAKQKDALMRWDIIDEKLVVNVEKLKGVLSQRFGFFETIRLVHSDETYVWYGYPQPWYDTGIKPRSRERD